MEMETGAVHQHGDGEVYTNLGVLLEATGVAPSPVNGKNGNGGGPPAVSDNASAAESETAASQNDAVGAMSESEGAMVTPDTKFVFRTWLMLGIFMILKRFLTTADLGVLFGDGNGPDRQHDSKRIQDGWKKLKKLHAAIGDAEKWRATLIAIVVGIEKKIGGGREFSFVDAAKQTKVVKDVGFGLAWALDADGRAELTSNILALEENEAWFGLPEVVEADHQAFIAKNQQREAARRQRESERMAEEARIEELSELGDLFAVAADVGVELTTVVDRETIQAAQAHLPEVGEVLESRPDQLMTGQNDEGQTFVSGIRFERLPGRKEQPFLPARFIPDRWRRIPDETTEDYERRLKASMVNGALLSVEKVEKDEHGRHRVLVQIRTPEELAEIRGRHVPFARPPRKLEEGESVTCRVVRRSEHGVQVVTPGNARLFCHLSNIAEGLSLAVGDEVYGVVIPGHGDREFDFAIRERVVEEDDGEEASPEYIIHAGRVEEIRAFVTERGISLTDDQQKFLLSCDERARKLIVITDEEIEAVHTFFGELLKDADRRFESVIVALSDYRREQEEAVEESQGEADTRPFCANHAEAGEQQCNRRVAKEGKQCLRCAKRGEPRKPLAGGKKRGVKGKHKKG